MVPDGVNVPQAVNARKAVNAQPPITLQRPVPGTDAVQDPDPVEADGVTTNEPAVEERVERHVTVMYKAGVAIGLAAGRLLRLRRPPR